MLAMPKRKRRTSNGETVTVKLVTALNHYFMGVGVRVGSFPETYGMNIIETVFYQSTNQVFHKSLDGSDG